MSTIQSHLSFFINSGELDIHSLVEEKNVLEIERMLEKFPEYKMSELKEHFADKYSYGELKMVMSYLDQKED